MTLRCHYDDGAGCVMVTLYRHEEEGGYEYASDQQGGEHGKPETRLEPAVLYQPLTSEAPSNEGTTGVVPLCEQNTTAGTGCTRDAGGVGHRVGKKLWKALTHDERGSNKDAYCEATAGGLFISWIPGVAQITAAGCAFRGLELLLNG
jgi:hypothetical protein